jgi:hypothetical protein
MLNTRDFLTGSICGQMEAKTAVDWKVLALNELSTLEII